MWTPLSLTIVNLFSHENSCFNFVNNQTTTIYGVNKTDQNVQSNGSGKTSILDCISIALLGEPLRDISKKEIVRNGEKSGQCHLILENKVLDQKIEIIREINATSSSRAQIYINNEIDTNLKDLSASETDKYIIKLLGISKDDLKNYFLISKDSYQSFFLNGDTAKKEIINRFSKANIIDSIEPLIKNDIALLDDTIIKLTTQSTANNGILAHLDEEISKEKLSSSIEQTRQLTINALESKRETIKALRDELPHKIDEKQKEINAQSKVIEKEELQLTMHEGLKTTEQDNIASLEKEITSISLKESEIESLYKPDFEIINSSIKECEKEINSYKVSRKECDREIEQLDIQLSGQIECPKCEHKFIAKNSNLCIDDLILKKKELIEIRDEVNTLIDEAENKVKELGKSSTDLKQLILEKNTKFVVDKNDLRAQLTKINAILFSIKKDINQQTELISTEHKKINNFKRDLEELDGKISFYINSMKEIDEAIEKEKAKVYPDKTTEIQDKIKFLTEQNVALQKDIDLWNADKSSLLEWQEKFKQFKSFLANTSILAIEEMTNFFLEKMKTSLRVSIEGYRELSNKKLKEEINCLVSRDGLNGESFTKFSGGEKAIIDLSCILSMQKIINIASESGGLNLLFIDEILESADSLVLSGIVKALSQLDQTILLITHIEQNQFDCNKLQVEKINGVSTITLN